MGKRSSLNEKNQEAAGTDWFLDAPQGVEHIAAQLPAAIYVLDCDANVVWLSREWLSITGLTVEESRSAGLLSPVHPDDALAVSSVKNTLFAESKAKALSAQPISLAYRIQNRTGSITRVVDRISVTVNASGDFVGYAGVIVEFEGSVQVDCVSDCKRLLQLSKRELQVAKCLVAGLANKAVARSLGISVRTVEAHRARLMKKLGLRSVAELVRLSLEDERAGGSGG